MVSSNGTAAVPGVGGVQMEALLSSQPAIITFTLLAIIATSCFAVEKLTSEPVDGSEPPVVTISWIPLIRQLTALWDFAHDYQRIANNIGAGICTVQLYRNKIYVANTAAIIHKVMRSTEAFSTDRKIIKIGTQILGIPRDPVVQHVERGTSEYVSGFLNGDHLRKLNTAAMEHFAKVLNDIGSDAPLQTDNFFGWVRDVVAIATIKALYGSDSPWHRDKDLVQCIWTFEEKRDQSQWRGWLFRKSQLAGGVAAMRKIHAAMGEFQREVRRDPSRHPGISGLIRARWEDMYKAKMPEKFHGMLDATAFAGTTNSAPAMFWILVSVFNRPDLVKQLQEEIERESIVQISPKGSPETGRRLAVVDLMRLVESCPLVTASFRETLRLYNDNIGEREVVKDVAMRDARTGQEFHLKEGVDVRWGASVLHADPSIWGHEYSCDDFAPERWLETNTPAKEKLRRDGFMPFGGGKHLCPGRHFAYAETVGFLAALVMGFELDGVHVPPKRMIHARAAVCHPAFDRSGRGKSVTVKRRAGWEDVEWKFHCENVVTTDAPSVG